MHFYIIILNLYFRDSIKIEPHSFQSCFLASKICIVYFEPDITVLLPDFKLDAISTHLLTMYVFINNFYLLFGMQFS